MFRSQADPCYPENSQQDGCYPDNAALPSRFLCWLTGQADSTQDGRPERGGKTPRGRVADLADLAALDPRDPRDSRDSRAGRPHR